MIGLKEILNGVVGYADGGKTVFVLESAGNGVVRSFSSAGKRVVRLKCIPVAYAVELYGGKSIGANGWTGTASYVIRKDGRTLLVSNAHVMTNKPWADGTDYPDIISPGVADGGGTVVAKYAGHVKIRMIGVSECPVMGAVAGIANAFSRAFGRKTRLIPVAGEANKVDVGWAEVLPDIQYELEAARLPDEKSVPLRGRIVGLLFAGSEADNLTLVCKMGNVLEAGAPGIDDYAVAAVGERLMKVGRTTGFTEGKVIATDAVMSVSYGAGIAVFEDIYVVRGEGVKFSAPGDSGSPVFK